HERWKEDALVLDKWFALQATSRTVGVAEVEELRRHPDFKMENPNRMRSLVGAFVMQNFRGFHAADGSGYELLADVVIELDAMNPQIATRLARVLGPWRQYAPAWGDAMKSASERILAKPGLSKDVFEIVSSSLS
ncbi:MAG: aminopeptidase N C-terminal domain-containing protein, partial [Planctomycetota bacterium]|nr:aminopeptidase N C-terminal domain-containing protein [Planctomycetota bacterium]